MAIFSYDKGTVQYHYAHQGGPAPTAIRIRWGYQGAGTPYTHTIAPLAYDGLVVFRMFLPGAGDYQAYMDVTDGTNTWATTAVETFTITTTGPGQARVLLFVL